MSIFKKKKIITEIKRNNLFDLSMLLLGATLSAIAFNLFLLPNNIVVGFSGLSVIANSLWGMKPSVFIAIGYIIILILSFIILGKKSTTRSIIGSILYPLLVEATSYIVADFSHLETIVLIICGGILSGIGSGIVYKVSYSTGGSDVINQILSKFMKRPIGTSMLITNGIIIAVGYLVFGIETVIYSLIVVYLMSILTDKVMIGISQSKSFYIITEHEVDVKKFLLGCLDHGVTVIDARGGYTGNVIKMIMCIAPTKEYIKIKENILNIDANALILVSDTYEVVGNK